MAERRARTGRIWEGDATVWTGRDEAYWLGWLDAPEREAARLGDYAELARVAAHKGVRDVLLLGMGGSSLGAEVLRRSLGRDSAVRSRSCMCSIRRTPTR